MKTNNTLVFFIGSYTEMLTEDFGGSGAGIYTVELNMKTGELSVLNTFSIRNPAYLKSSGNALYAITEVEQHKTPKVSAFKINNKQNLEFVNEQIVDGSLPCHVDLHDNNLLIACYGSGNLLGFEIDGDDAIKPHKYNFKHEGSSVNKTRQEVPHAHQVAIHPNKMQIFVPDLGIDTVKAYRFEHGILEATPDYDISIPKGNGPRHMVFNKKGGLAYVMNELTGQVALLKLNTVKFECEEMYASLPKDFKGLPSGSAIRIHPNGKFLYVANRTVDAITIFRIKEAALEILEYHYIDGKTIREFNITPNGEWLIACMQDSNEVISYKILESGVLKEKRRTSKIISPVCVCFK